MPFTRRQAALTATGLVFLFAGSARAAERKTPLLAGALTEDTYPDFESFIDDHVKAVVGLDVTVKRSGSGDAPLQAGTDNGKLVVYLNSTPDAPSESEIVAGGGFTYRNGVYHLDGLFAVRNEGTHQGVVSYSLRKTGDLAGKLERVELGKGR